ncbi:hypothetical protein D9753_16845 [Streptomyces dangxiongensis]|uniref:Uncharacterized protein n=2 Tax=Streptomyces dangxiongensis TaxID=1442032 RepID=A0A3G2JIS7_9ACTN|nr:hypothetical protein D9753_16845 [Streptomyces dangxiongensis]
MRARVIARTATYVRETGECMMNAGTTGLAAGMALGFAGYFGGFWAFLLVLVLGAAGLIVGLVVQGDLDLRPRRQR